MTNPAAPYLEDTPALLAGTLTHTAAARVVLPSGEQCELELEGGTLEWDETRAPRVSADLSCRLVDDQALLDRLDPRTGARLQVDAGYVRPDGLTDAHTIADLSFRRRRVQRPDDRMPVEGLSDEALVIDNAASTSLTVNQASTVAGIQYVIGLVLPAATITTTAPAGPAVNTVAAPGDKWDTIADLANQAGARVFDDGLRGWHIDPSPVLTAPVHTVATGPAGTITSSDTGLGRDDGWYNRVFLRYEWTDAGGTDHVVVTVKSVTSGPFTTTGGNVRCYTREIRDVATTQAQADAAATALLKRLVNRGRSFELDAVSAYWIRPGMTVTEALPLGDSEDHLVSAVSFDLATGLMRLRTRLPQDDPAIT